MTDSIVRNERQPKILLVTSHWPLAPAYGAQQRVLNLARLMTKFAQVSWVIAPSEHEDEETARRSMREFDVRAVLRPSLVGPRSGQLFRRLRHEFDRSFMEPDDYVAEESDRARLVELISEHDVVWIHTIRTAQWFCIDRWPHSVLDIDDMPSAVYRSTAHANGTLSRRLKDRRMAWVWARRESFLTNRFDVLTVCSEADRSSLKETERIHVIPNGANLQTLHARRNAGRPIIGFIGNCGFWPNEDGLKWFIREAWPSIKREVPSVQLHIVGAQSEKFLSSKEPDIVGMGWLADPGEEIASWSAMIVPIKTGSGTRVKIADGFARKCPVVATPFGASGYEVENGRELLLAETSGEFSSACVRLVQNPSIGVELAERAYSRFCDVWTWDSFEASVEAAVRDCLARSGAPGSPMPKGGASGR